MNPKEIVKSSRLSHTPILRKTQKDIKKLNTKFVDDNDDFEKHTALIIEDEELQRNIIAKKLPKDFKWYSAKSVKEAVEVYESLVKKYIIVDVLFLDLFLQDSKGTEFLKIAQTKGWLENCLIVVMTGSKDIDTIKECIDCLGNRFYKFYSKPVKDVEFEKLLDEIRKHVDKNACPLKGYKIIKHVGAGMQADVYQVISLKNRKLYAMKVNKDKNLNSKEVQCLKKLNSPTIIHLYESQILNGKEYMILEYAERGTLYERVKQYSKTNQKFSQTQILDWITEIIIGLYSLHKKDIMHRDIKSDNLFLCNNDVVKIGDLGQASNESKCKSFVGTFFYRAPECQDFGEYKKEIDIWSAGVVLYELIMLVRPFEGIEQKEVQKRIENIDYKPLPEDTDPKLKKLLEYTLTYQESRATAAQLLSLEFIKARIKYLCSNKILELEPSFMEEILNLNYKIGDIVAPKAVIKEYNFLKIFQNMQLIYYKYARTVLYSDLFFNTILVFSHSCLYSKTLKEEEIRDLIDLGIIVPYEIDKDNNKNKKTKTKGKKDKYNAKYYNIVKNKIDGIDNTLNLPINDDDFFDNFYLDGLETSFKAFEKAKKTFNLFRRILEDEEINEEDKYNFSCSEEIYDFLLEIKNFQNINLNKYLGEEKIAIMLNIYQTMIYHYIIKCVMVDSDFEDKINASLFQNLMASLKIGKFNISLKYKIAGEIFTIQDMKHTIFKIKSPPIFFFYQPSVKDDQRLKILDEKYLNKLSFLNRLAILTICIDPPNFIDDDVSDIYAPVGICFKPNTLFKDLNSSLYHFISEKNVFPDENTVNFPKFIHEYIISLGKKENDVIQSLIEFFYKDFTQKMYRLINKSKQNILHINYC